MLNNQNLILVAISIVSLTSIYLLYTNYQKMQDVAMIREEIVLLKSSLSKMNTYENEIFVKINERLKQLEEGLVRSQVPGRNISSDEQTNNNELTEENVELLNQNFKDEPNVVDVSTEGVEPLDLKVDEIQELNNLQEDVTEIDNNIIIDEMRNISDTYNNDVLLNKINNLEVNDTNEIEDIDLEELDNSNSINTEHSNDEQYNDEQVIEQLQNINQPINSLQVTSLDIETEGITDEDSNDDSNEDISLEALITEKEVTESFENPEITQVLEKNENKSPLDSFLIENGVDNLDDELSDDLDLDNLDDLNVDENPISTPKELSEKYLSGLTVKELKGISKQKGLKTRGNKKELINVILGNKH